MGRGGFSNIQTIVSTRRMSLFRRKSSTISVTAARRSSIVDFEQQPSSAHKLVPSGDSGSPMSLAVKSIRKSIARDGQYNGKSLAVKSIRRSIDTYTQFSGIIDLAKEAKFLSVLSHKNIINLHGTANNPGGIDYFIVIERLECCLSERCTDWLKEKEATSNSKLPRKKIAEKKQRLVEQRLLALLGVAAGLEYLHGHKYVYGSSGFVFPVFVLQLSHLTLSSLFERIAAFCFVILSHKTLASISMDAQRSSILV